MFGGHYSYPHSIYYELLAETGIVGFLSISTIFLFAFYKGISLAKASDTQILYILLIASVFVRAMVSDSFAGNIQIFSILFSGFFISTEFITRNEPIIKTESGFSLFGKKYIPYMGS